MSAILAELPIPRPRAADEPSDYVDHPSGFLALSKGNEIIATKGCPGFAAVRCHGRHMFLMGGVHAPPALRPAMLERVRWEAHLRGLSVVGVQVREDQVDMFRDFGFTVNQFGASYALPVHSFSLEGGDKRKMRNKLRRAENEGLRVVEVGREVPRDAATWTALQDVSRRWLAAKGKKELEFMIGELGRPEDRRRRVFAAQDAAGRIQGFITYVPAWGRRPGWLHDLTRKVPEAPPGTMELINVAAIEAFLKEGGGHLHFGFTPFLLARTEEPGDSSPWVARTIRLLGKYGSFVYPAQEQVDYKLKWGVQVVDPEYLAFDRLSVRAIVDLLLVTRSL